MDHPGDATPASSSSNTGTAHTAAMPAQDRYLWRIQQLLRRYLLAFGPWFEVERSRDRPTGFQVEAFLAEFLAGRFPSADQRAQLAASSQALEQEQRTRGMPPQPLWARYEHLCRSAGLDALARDAVLLLLAPWVDSGVAWFLRCLTGRDAGAAGLPTNMLRHMLDPLALHAEAVERAVGAGALSSRRGLLRHAATDHAIALAPLAIQYLLGGPEALAGPRPWSGKVWPRAQCATLAQRAQLDMGRSLERLASARRMSSAVVVCGPPGCGARWLAAFVATELDSELVELDASELPGHHWLDITAELAIRGAALFVSGNPLAGLPARARADILGRLEALVCPLLLIHLPDDTSAADMTAVIDATRASGFALDHGTARERITQWQSALLRTQTPRESEHEHWPLALSAYPLGIEQIEQALTTARVRGTDGVLSAIHRACQSLAPTPLDTLAERLVLTAEPFLLELPMPLLDRLDRLRTGLDQGSERGLGILALEPEDGELRTAAALIGCKLGRQVFAVSPRLLGRQRQDARVWLAEILAAARAIQAALLFEDLPAFGARDPELQAVFVDLLATHDGLIFLSRADRAALDSADPDPVGPRSSDTGDSRESPKSPQVQ